MSKSEGESLKYVLPSFNGREFSTYLLENKDGKKLLRNTAVNIISSSKLDDIYDGVALGSYKNDIEDITHARFFKNDEDAKKGYEEISKDLKFRFSKIADQFTVVDTFKINAEMIDNSEFNTQLETALEGLSSSVVDRIKQFTQLIHECALLDDCPYGTKTEEAIENDIDETVEKMKKLWEETPPVEKILLAPTLLYYSLQIGSPRAAQFCLDEFDQFAIDTAKVYLAFRTFQGFYLWDGNRTVIDIMFNNKNLSTEKILSRILSRNHYYLLHNIVENKQWDRLKQCWACMTGKQRIEIANNTKFLEGIYDKDDLTMLKWLLSKASSEQRKDIVDTLTNSNKKEHREFALTIVGLEKVSFLDFVQQNDFQILRYALVYDFDSINKRYVKETNKIDPEVFDFLMASVCGELDDPHLYTALESHFRYALTNLANMGDERAKEKQRVVLAEFKILADDEKSIEERLTDLKTSLENDLQTDRDEGIRVNRGTGAYFWKGVFTRGSRNPFDHRIARSTTELNANRLYRQLSDYIEEKFPAESDLSVDL